MASPTAAPSLKLNSGYYMPQVGLGTWQASDEDVTIAVETALEAGYRMIDTAFVYRNEAAIGRVLKKWLESGRVTRDQLFITTKLPFHGMHADKVTHFCELSLKNLGLEYVDMYLVHNPVGSVYIDDNTTIAMKPDGTPDLDMNTDLEAIWKAMEDQVRAGRVRSIGISNFTTSQVDRIVKVSSILPSNHQLELHASMQQIPIREQAKRHGIIVTSYGSLGSPGRQQANIKNKESARILTNPVVEAIAKTKNKQPAQILLKHLLQHGIIVIPKSVSSERVKQNFDLFDFSLSPEEMQTLDKLDKGAEGRTTDFRFFMKGYENHPEYPFGSY